MPNAVHNFLRSLVVLALLVAPNFAIAAVVIQDIGVCELNSGATGNDCPGTGDLTVPYNLPVGTLVIVVIMDIGRTTAPGEFGSGVSDSQNNDYLTGGTCALAGSASNGYVWWAYSFITTALTAGVDNLGYTDGTAGKANAASSFSVSGVNSVDSVVSACANGTGTSVSVTSGTPAVSGEAFMAFTAWTGATSLVTYSQDTTHGWATPPDGLAANVTPFNGIEGGTQVNAGASSKVFSPTFNKSAKWAALIFGAKPSGVVSETCIITLTGAGPC